MANWRMYVLPKGEVTFWFKIIAAFLKWKLSCKNDYMLNIRSN